MTRATPVRFGVPHNARGCIPSRSPSTGSLTVMLSGALGRWGSRTSRAMGLIAGFAFALLMPGFEGPKNGRLPTVLPRPRS